MKAYTDLEQSKKLAEILPVESADMCFNDNEPCWSLSALLQIIPHCIEDRYWLVLGTLAGDSGWYVCYEEDEVNLSLRYYIARSNLIDACYEMIIKLHEEKMIGFNKN